MTKYLWPVTTLGLVLLMGVGILVAPFALHFYPHGGSWNRATSWTFWSGVGVIVMAIIGIYGWLSGIGAEARRMTPHPAAAVSGSESEPESEPPEAASDGDEALQQLARAVLRDLNQRLGDGGAGAGGGSLR